MISSENQDKPNILWLTNLPAPYRVKIWEALNLNYNLEVAFSLKKTNWRNWKLPIGVSFGHQYLGKHSLHLGEFDLIPSPFGAKKLLNQKDCVVVGGWESPIYFSTIRRARSKGIPVIQFYESTRASHRFKGFVVRNLRSKLFSLADLIVTPGKGSTDAVLDMGIKPEKIRTIFNPVDIQSFLISSESNPESQESGHKYVYVGRLIELKNVSTLIHAFSSIRLPADSLTIVGDGPLAARLHELVRDLNLVEVVHFYGHKSQIEVTKIYRESHTLVLPSTIEVWGLVVNEALLSGLHVVVSKAAGVADLIQSMKGAYIVEPNLTQLADAMNQSRSDWHGRIPNPEIMAFSPENFAGKLAEVIEEILPKINSPRLTWVTNIPTPYRIPIWRCLDLEINLKLIFFNSTERGRKWDLISQISQLKYKFLGTKAMYPDKLTPLYFNWIKVWSSIKRTRPQWIYFDGYESPAFFIPAFLARRNRIKVIFGYRSTIESHRFNGLIARKMRSYILSFADLIVTAGRASTNAVMDMGISPEKIVTLFNPIDVAWFSGFAEIHRRVHEGGHRFLYVGQLISRKNLPSLLEAFALIREPQDTLTIVGDGDLLSALQNLAYSLGIDDFICFKGHHNQEQIALDYANADTLILPSRNEVWGLVVNEALASGLHVVVSKSSGVAEFVEPMRGAYVASANAGDLANAMKRSRAEWLGPIANPEILIYTPEKFAEVLVSLL